MNKEVMRSVARALGGRVKSLIAQVARREASRFVRHLRERLKKAFAPAAPPPAPLQLESPAAANPVEAPLAVPESTVAQPGPGTSTKSPAKRTNTPKAPGRRAAAKKAGAASETVTTVNINAASRAELVALPGIGPSRADAILNGRPYQNPAELVERRILPPSLFTSLRERLRTD